MKVGDPPRLGNPPVHFLFYLDHVYVMGRVTRLGGLPGLPGRVTLSAGVTICPADIFNYSNYFYKINFF